MAALVIIESGIVFRASMQQSNDAEITRHKIKSFDALRGVKHHPELDFGG